MAVRRHSQKTKHLDRNGEGFRASDTVKAKLLFFSGVVRRKRGRGEKEILGEGLKKEVRRGKRR